jgi:radical SAM protein with 4Fe4S-binding SPASM domain
MDDARRKRIEEHRASVIATDSGLQFKSIDIITPKGLAKKNKLITVMPAPDETIVPLGDVPYLFSQLKQMNLILTNACNLACTYCYEQHGKDFGRFTPESLLTAYRFLNNSNDHQRKVFQFFGGEPLIHKDLIMNFIRDNQEELRENSKGDFNTVVGCVTNGLLLTQDLVDEYFSYDFTWMLISLDTDRAEVDHREIGQEKINKLMNQLRTIPDAPKQEKRVTIRVTLARENAPYFRDFVDNLYAVGIRRLVVHPLVLDSARGFIQWEEHEWGTLHDDIINSLKYYHDLQIHFSEGVGKKGEENCMIGSDMIAIDGSGDFSGCYFFTNQKAGPAGKTILGNVFDDKIYLDRYKGFQKEYAKMFEEEEQCKTCDYKNACYQCPAGNMDTGSKTLFRPDDMCQKIVKLFVDLQEDIAKKQFRTKYDILIQALDNEGCNITQLKALAYLIFFYVYNYHPDKDIVHERVEERFKTPEHLLGFWLDLMNSEHNLRDIQKSEFMDYIASKIDDSKQCTIDEFYYKALNKMGKTPAVNVKAETDQQKIFYLALLHMIILIPETKALEDTFKYKLVDDNDTARETP